MPGPAHRSARFARKRVLLHNPRMTATSLLPPVTAPAPVLVGFSGGLDSTVLLHLLAHDPAQRERGLRAVHVHHGLQAAADDWAAQCQHLCTAWRIPLHVAHVHVNDTDGNGPEAAARHARHAAFAEWLQPGEWLALAHHQDDQAETFLLRALRGSGIDGLAAMRERRDFAAGQLWRPLLHTPRTALAAYALQHGLHWIEDPSNGQDGFDRNFLRNQVLPLLAQRWPRANALFARSAALAAEADDLLHGHDLHALQHCMDNDGTLSIAGLASLPAAQCARVLRLWVRQRGLPPLPGHGVERILHDLLAVADDQQAEFRWQQARVVRWNRRLHALRVLPPWPAGWHRAWDGRMPLALPDGGVLALHSSDGFDRPVQVRQRQGGERIQLPGRSHSHLLKHRLQAATIAPWLRPHLPLLCDGTQVLAAGDRIVSAPLHGWLQAHGARLHWQAPCMAN